MSGFPKRMRFKCHIDSNSISNCVEKKSESVCVDERGYISFEAISRPLFFNDSNKNNNSSPIQIFVHTK